jgi:transcriptional regulator with XRE-family HTH domain
MTDHLLKELGEALRARRKAAGFSQESYADHIQMHRTYYSAIERGEKNLQLDTLQRICLGLGCKMWEVLREAETSSVDQTIDPQKGRGS